MRYDSPLAFWDDPSAFYDFPDGKVKMRFVSTGMSGLNQSERLVRSQDIVTHLTGNASFPTLNPPLASVQTHIDDATAKTAAAVAAVTAARMAIQARNAAMALVDNDVSRLARNVEIVANGNEEMILSSGFLLRAPATPPQIPAAPGNLRVQAGEFPGQLLVRFETVEDAVIYYVETAANPMEPASWVRRASSTRPSVTLDGLPSGGECWVRVAGDGPAGHGPWSDPALKRVP